MQVLTKDAKGPAVILKHAAENSYGYLPIYLHILTGPHPPNPQTMISIQEYLL